LFGIVIFEPSSRRPGRNAF